MDLAEHCLDDQQPGTLPSDLPFSLLLWGQTCVAVG